MRGKSAAPISAGRRFARADDARGVGAGAEEHPAEERVRERGESDEVDRRAHRLLGLRGVADAEPAAVDQHDAGDAVRSAAVGLEHDATAQAVADENRFLQIPLLDEPRDVGPERLDRAVGRVARRPPVTAQVAGDHGLRGFELGDLGRPVGVVAREAVHEDHLRHAAAGAADEHLG